MKIIEITQFSQSATASQLWNLWSDLDQRSAWDDGLESITSEQPFGLGQTGVVKVKGQAARKFEVIECTKNKSYTDRFFLPASAKMDWHHELDQTPDGIAVTWRVEVSGPTSFILRPILKGILAKELPGVIAKFIRLAGETESAT